MTESEFSFLLTSQAQQVLAEYSTLDLSSSALMKASETLRQTFSADQVNTILTTIRLRQRAKAKFSKAENMYFTQDALEQASADVVTAYRARRFESYDNVLDLCCGIGGDAIGLAAFSENEARRVHGVDLDPVRLAMATENVRAYGGRQRFVTHCQDVHDAVRSLESNAWFVDPARRVSADHGQSAERAKQNQKKRIFDPEECSPPLSQVLAWRDFSPNGGVKLGPGIDHALVPADAEIEFISVKNEVREAVMWFGGLSTGDGVRRATLLPDGHSIFTVKEPDEDDVPVLPLGRWIHEPDKAVIRAHLVRTLAVQNKAWRIDGQIAYLSTDSIVASPFWASYEVETWMPFSKQKLKKYLKEKNVGDVILKKRGSRVDLDQLRPALKGKGAETRVVFLTQINDKPVAIIAHPSSVSQTES